MNILKYLNDTAVLWEVGTPNGYGELTFTAGVEIPVRWEDRQEVFVGKDAVNLISRAVVHVNQDITPDSFLFLGELTDLTDLQIANPKLHESAFAVKAFIKMPSIDGNYILRKVYLFGGDVQQGPVGR